MKRNASEGAHFFHKQADQYKSYQQTAALSSLCFHADVPYQNPFGDRQQRFIEREAEIGFHPVYSGIGQRAVRAYYVKFYLLVCVNEILLAAINILHLNSFVPGVFMFKQCDPVAIYPHLGIISVT